MRAKDDPNLEIIKGIGWAHLFPIDFTPILPQIDANREGVIYYVRVVAVGVGEKPGQMVAYPSPSIKIKFGIPDAPLVQIPQPVTMERELPWLEMKVEYAPKQDVQPGAMYQFIVVNDPSLKDCAEYGEPICGGCDPAANPDCQCTPGSCIKTFEEAGFYRSL